jgi:hypothetical protein
MPPEVIESGLNQFEKDGLIVAEGEGSKTYGYRPNSSSLDDSVEQTAKLYNSQRVSVINHIFSAPMQSFSDAFKFRQEDS